MPRFSSDLPRPGPRAHGDPLVEAELRRWIRARGRITFAQFMAIALYLLDGGYYEAYVELGRSGDFLTSPETHPAFGALLARLVHSLWCALGAPEPFHVVEYGAGTGSLCRQVLDAAPHVDPAFDHALRYAIIETSAYLRATQQAALLDCTDRVTWVHPGHRAELAFGCVLANEVVDALPVHRVKLEQGKLRELYVTMSADRYLETPGDLSAPELERYFHRLNLRPPEGAVVEVCLQAGEWLADAAGRIASGYLVTIDHGGSAHDLVARATPRGGLKCFSRHGWTEDPYDRPGLQDITAPVDFTNLTLIGASLGFEAALETSQGELLRFLGIESMRKRLEALDLSVMERRRNLRALSSLADPQGLGAFRVLVQQKHAPPFALAAEDVETTLWGPLLPGEPVEWPQP